MVRKKTEDCGLIFPPEEANAALSGIPGNDRLSVADEDRVKIVTIYDGDCYLDGTPVGESAADDLDILLDRLEADGDKFLMETLISFAGLCCEGVERSTNYDELLDLYLGKVIDFMLMMANRDSSYAEMKKFIPALAIMVDDAQVKLMGRMTAETKFEAINVIDA